MIYFLYFIPTYIFNNLAIIRRNIKYLVWFNYTVTFKCLCSRGIKLWQFPKTPKS